MTSHDALERLKQALLESRDVIISGQICSSKLQRVFTLGDGCWLPIFLISEVHFLPCEVISKKSLKRFFGEVLSLGQRWPSTGCQKGLSLEKPKSEICGWRVPSWSEWKGKILVERHSQGYDCLNMLEHR